ncbi:MAG: DUF4249 domain-containing protein [Bacteroidota bacterium]
MLKSQSYQYEWIIFLLTFGVLLATSCEEPVDLDFAVQESQIVVNSHFVEGEPFRVTLTKSKNILTTEPEEFVNNAIVKIFDPQGTALEELRLVHFRTPYYESRSLQPTSGKTYRLEVTVPDYPQIIAEDIVPLPVALQSIEMDTLEILGAAEDKLYKVAINVHFDDPIGAQDYYHLSLYNDLSVVDNGSMFSEGPDDNRKNLTPLMPLESDPTNPTVTFHYEDGGVLFTDEAFDGQDASLKFYSLLSLNNADHQGKIVGELRTVSRAYYLYQTSLARQIANKDRPFVEPTRVYSNIENGLGIFSGYAQYRDSVAISASY